MSKPILAIDCDDVLVGTAPYILAAYNAEHGTNIQLKDFYSNNDAVWGVTDDIATARVNAYLNTPEYHGVAPFQEAVSALTRLSTRYELHVVTGRHSALSDATHTMLEQYFPGLFSSVEFTSFFTKNSRSKADVCEQLGASYLIDDHLHHAEVVAARGIPVLLFGLYPWNQTDNPLPPSIRRVVDWEEVCKILL